MFPVLKISGLNLTDNEIGSDANPVVVIVSGYFSPLHCGHLDYLEEAAIAGDRLLVIVNNNEQQVMKKGALDEMTKELIYIAVSITNSCEYCIKSHSSAAIKKGASKDMLAELNAVVGMANETNKLVESYQVKVDEIYE